MRVILSLLVLLNFLHTANAQDTVQTSTSTHIFWKPNLVIDAADYQGPPIDSELKVMQEHGIKASASTGIWAVLDIPKKSFRGQLPEKGYFVAAFEKTTSFKIDADPHQIAIQNIYLDICEIAARGAREQIKKLQDSIKTDNVLVLYFERVKADMQEMKKALFSAYFYDVIADKKEGAFEKWKDIINTLLKESEQWATSPEEYRRFITRKPVDKKYMQAKMLVAAE